MKKIFILLLSFVSVSCSSSNNGGNTSKPVTQNIPSADKFKKEGTPLNSRMSAESSVIASAPSAKEYNLLERLYDTVWYQTEKDYDDGELEVETEFVMFNKKSWIVEREMENGHMEKVEDDDYSYLTWCEDVNPETTKRNAVIALNRESGDSPEYEGYWMKDPNNLFIVEGDNKAEVKKHLLRLIANADLAEFLDTEHYILSTNLGK